MALLSSLLEILNSTSTGALITSVVVTDSGYNNLDDTAIATSNSFIKIIGSGFTANSNVFIGNVQVPAANVTYTGTTELRVALPNITLGTDSTVSVFNSTGSGGIYVSRLLSSGFPSVTTSAYSSSTLAINTQLLATGDGTLTYSLKSGSSLPTGLTLNANGLISGTATADQTASFTVLVDDAQKQTVQQDITLLISSTDAYFNNTTLLVQADNAANNSTNGSVVDSSNNYNLVTTAGTPIQGSINPFGIGNWSNSFNGGTQYVSAPNNALINQLPANFTIEFWAYATTTTNSVDQVFNFGNFTCMIYHSGTTWTLEMGNGTTSNYFTLSGTASLNSWHHFAFTRYNNTYTLWIDGQSAQTTTNSNTPGTANKTLYIGRNETGGQGFTGYISNYRIVNGTALYTTTFTPSTTPLTAVANTALLTCQSNRFIDNSTNAFTVTPTNSPTVERFNPFDVNANSYTTQANTMISGSTYIGSGYHYFGHSGFGSGDFSVEFWAYVTASGGSLFNNYVQYSPGDNGMYIYYDGAGSRFAAYVKRDNGYDSGNLYAGTSLSLNTWYHVVLCRTSGTLSLFVNGTRGSTVASYVQTFTQTQSGIGNNGSGTSYQGNSQCAGAYLSNFRIMAGTSAYNAANSSFTVPTTPLTAVANTLFLAYQTSQGESSRTVTTSGTVTASKLAPPTIYSAVTDTSTANTIYSGSYYFNGSSYLQATNTGQFDVTGPFTVECWAYYTSTTSGSAIGVGGGAANWSTSNGHEWILTPSSSGTLYWQFNTSGTNTNMTATPGPVNQWNHIAVGYNGTTTRMWLNGVSVSTSTAAYTLPTSRGTLRVGNIASSDSAYTGYISNARFVKQDVYGVGNSSITVPVAPLQPTANTTNTSLLLTGTNSGIYDQTLQNSIRGSGATVNTNVFKYGTGSMFFNGTSDFLQVGATPGPLTPLLTAGAVLTMEAWVYPTSLRAGSLAYTQPSILGLGGTYMNFGVNNGVPVFYWYSGVASSLSSSISITANTWSHIAVVINGTGSSNLKIYVNGVLGGTGTFVNISWSSSSGGNNVYIGKEETNPATSCWPGYIDELRITRSARYTANFTPSIVAFNSKSRSN